MSNKQEETKKRVIVSHKGGRTERFYCRIKPEVKESLLKLAATKGITTADLIERWILKNNL